jgi:hypothetical protein
MLKHMKQNITERIASRFKAAQAASVGHRGDMYLADYLPVTKLTAQVLVGYESTLGVPTKKDLIAFTTGLSNEMCAMVKTAQHYPQKDAISLFVCKQAETKTLEEASNPKEFHENVPGQQWMHTRTAEVWNVDNINGEKVLVREQEDDIAAILEARKNCTRTASVTKDISFNEIKEAQGIGHIDVEDLVEFLYNDEIGKGIVKRVVNTDTGARVVVDQNGNMLDISIESITKVMPASQNVAKEKSHLYNYYKAIYGEEYARQLIYTESV